MVSSEVSAAAKPLITLAGQLVGPARQLLAERAAGRSDLAVDANLLTVGLRETVDRLADIDRNQTWWREFLRSMGHQIVTPKYLRINAVQEWMRDVSVSTAITDVAKVRITSAPRSQEVKPRAHLRSTYARYTGEHAALADGPIEAIVGIVLASFVTNLRTQGGLVAVAGLVQEAHRRSYTQIEDLSSRLERLEDLLLQLSGSSAQGHPTATRASRVLGSLIAVPSLPPYFVHRPRELAELKATILATARTPIAITGTPSRIGLQGMGGIGKSVLAAALAHDEDVREAFPDGVIWIRIGREHGGPADLRSAQVFLARAVGANPPQIGDVPQGLGLLGPLLARKQCLLILDDVWAVDEIDAFDILGPASRMLLTTRDASITRSIGGLEHELGLLDPASARDLLSRWAGLQVKDLPTTASAVAEECDRLPLALALCGALVRSGIPWHQVLDALRAADLAFVDSRLPNYPYSNLLKALQVSVEALRDYNADWADRYLELAVLSLKSPVPETAIARLWLRTGGLAQRDCTKIVTALHERALLRADGNAPFRYVSIHDIQQDYLTALCSQLDLLNAELLQAYSQSCPGGHWSEGPDDGYFYQNLAYHLVRAGRRSELKNLLLDAQWLYRKLLVTDVTSLISDFDWFAADANLGFLRSSITLAAHVIGQRPEELPPQLLGRLLDSSSNPDIARVMGSTDGWTHNPWFRPLAQSLSSANESLERVLAGHENPVYSLLALRNSNMLVSGDKRGVLRSWDMSSG